MRAHTFSSSILVLALLTAVSSTTRASPLTIGQVNVVGFTPLPNPPSKMPSAVILRAEVLLDRARFSPGAIDGLDGDNFRKAVHAFQGQAGLPVDGQLNQATWDKLVAGDGAPVLVTRTLTKAEAKGPFVKRIPAKMEAQAKLRRLGYRSLDEEVAEEVHVSPALLLALNGGHKLKAGEAIVVPQVVVDRGAPAAVTRIAVDKTLHAVEAYGPDNKLLAFYPASIGSTEKPAPSGDFVIKHVTHNPDYTYNPAYAFKGVKATKPFTIPPGPNNPVGSVWMALSDEGYGIHGTPEPDRVGKTQSHGCIRLTNWDVEDLASMVKAGTAVSFEQPEAPPATPTASPAPQPPSPATAPASATTPTPASPGP